MSTRFRSLLGMSAGALVLSASACATPAGGGDSEQPETSQPQQSKALEQFDPCTFFNPDELTSWGVSTNAEDATQVSWEPGCSWSGDEKTVGIHKNLEETVSSYQQSGNWDSYEPQQIAGRSGAVAVVAGGSDTGACNVLVDTGGGVAMYQIQLMQGTVAESCEPLKDIAEQTASRLPQ